MWFSTHMCRSCDIPTACSCGLFHSLNLENLTCVIRCCAYPSTAADDEGDGGMRMTWKVVMQTRMSNRISILLRKIYTDQKKSSKFFLTLPSLRQSKKDKFKNKAAGCYRLVRDTEIVHSSSANQKPNSEGERFWLGVYNTNIKWIWLIIWNWKEIILATLLSCPS